MTSSPLADLAFRVVALMLFGRILENHDACFVSFSASAWNQLTCSRAHSHSPIAAPAGAGCQPTVTSSKLDPSSYRVKCTDDTSRKSDWQRRVCCLSCLIWRGLSVSITSKMWPARRIEAVKH